MKDRHGYERVLKIIVIKIRAWDPYNLIAESAPSDEFDDQIARITAKVPTFHGIDEIAGVISTVFSEPFGPDSFTPTNDFIPAQEIFMALRHAKLLPSL